MAEAIEYRQRFGHKRNRARILTGFVALVVVIALGTLGFVYRTALGAGFDFLLEETGSRAAAAACVAGALMALIVLGFWVFFPILVYLNLRSLRRQNTELDEQIRLCLRHLAQLADARDLAKESAIREKDRITAPKPNEAKPT